MSFPLAMDIMVLFRLRDEVDSQIPVPDDNPCVAVHLTFMTI